MKIISLKINYNEERKNSFFVEEKTRHYYDKY